MHRKTTTLALATALTSVAIWGGAIGEPAWAQEDDEFILTDDSERSVVTEEEATEGLRDENVGIKPQAGILLFDSTAGNQSRLAYGLTMDFNMSESVGAAGTPWYFGPSTGVIYSHLGQADSDLLGTEGGESYGGGANMFVVPANLKFGWNASEMMRISTHGGVNVLYRSSPGVIATTDDATIGDRWTVYPNVGADLEFALGSNSAFVLRPDVTLTPGNDIFTGTLGFSFFG